jgi:hypothetical protein
MVAADRTAAFAERAADQTADHAAVGFCVAATVLGVKPFLFQTTAEDLDSRLVFLSPNQIVAGAPVKLETDNSLWLGHVVECRPRNDRWRTVVQIEHSLTNLPELLKLAARFE